MSEPLSQIRGLSPGFHDALAAAAAHPGWWRDVLAHPDLVLAVRAEAVNVYHHGASILRIIPAGCATTAGASLGLAAQIHAKYLLRQRQALVRLNAGGGLALDPAELVWTAYAGPQTLAEWLRAAAPLAGLEKTGLHQLLRRAPNVIDVESALTGPDGGDNADADHADAAGIDEAAEGYDVGLLVDTATGAGAPAQPRQDRLDVASLEARGAPDEAWLVFHEAKLAANPELRAAPDRTPAVITQIARYTTALGRHAERLAAGYTGLCRDLVRLDTLRQRVQAETGVPDADRARHDSLVAEVAQGRRRLRVDLVPRLVVFGFDADQRDGILGGHLKRLQAPPFALTLRALGDPAAGTGNAFRAP